MSNYYAGRPTSYRPEMDEVVVREMSEGASITEVAAAIGITPDTLYEWIKPLDSSGNPNSYYKPTFSEAVKFGRELSKKWWLEQGRKNLNNKGFNSALWYMNMKNRHGWSDRTEVSGNVQVETTVTHTLDQGTKQLLSGWTEYLKRNTLTGVDTPPKQVQEGEVVPDNQNS